MTPETRPPSPHQPVPREPASKGRNKERCEKRRKVWTYLQKSRGQKESSGETGSNWISWCLASLSFRILPGADCLVHAHSSRGQRARPIARRSSAGPSSIVYALSLRQHHHNTTVRSGLRLESSTIGVLYKQYYTKAAAQPTISFFFNFSVFFFFCFFFFFLQVGRLATAASRGKPGGAREMVWLVWHQRTSGSRTST